VPESGKGGNEGDGRGERRERKESRTGTSRWLLRPGVIEKEKPRVYSAPLFDPLCCFVESTKRTCTRRYHRNTSRSTGGGGIEEDVSEEEGEGNG
jgi:hypothetical protein